MMGICYPKEYGGGGHSYLAYIAVIEELAKHCSTTSVMLSDHHSLGSFPLSEFGTEEQKQKYLAPLARGEKLGAVCSDRAGRRYRRTGLPDQSSIRRRRVDIERF